MARDRASMIMFTTVVKRIRNNARSKRTSANALSM